MRVGEATVAVVLDAQGQPDQVLFGTQEVMSVAFLEALFDAVQEVRDSRPAPQVLIGLKEPQAGETNAR